MLPLLAFILLPAVADDTTEYRLAGTMQTAVDEWLAVLELPGGEQRLLRVGDAIPGGEVVEIDAAWLRLRVRDDLLTLALEGDASHANQHIPDAMFLTSQASISLQDALKRLRAGAGNASQLAEDISRVLQIPDGGEIDAIDDHPVESSAQSLELLLRSLGENRPVRIEVSGVEGFDAVYLTPMLANEEE